MRRATFSCALPDGRYAASIWMGALWRTGIEDMNHVVEVAGARVVDDARDFNRLMDEEYFRCVHSTLVTSDDVKRGGLAVHDSTQRCWLSVKVPDDARGGLYHGEVRFEPQNAPASVLKLELRVLPFELKRPERIHVMRRAGNQVLIPYPATYPVEPGDVRNKQFYRRAAIRDLHEHGFSPEYAVWWPLVYDREQGGIRWDAYSSMSGTPEQFLRLIKDSPFGRQTTIWVDGSSMHHLDLFDAFGEGSPKWDVEETRRWLVQLSRKMADEGFTTVYLHASAEESHFPPGRGAEAWQKFLAFVREGRSQWPNVLTAHTCNTSWGQPIAVREADLAGLGMFHGAGNDGRAQVDQARATGRPYILYGARGRMVPGFYLWKAGASGTFHEFYAPYSGVLNNDWDNPLGMDNAGRQVLNEAPGWSNAVYSPTGRMIGSWFWEEMREGVDDDAYLSTLEHWIESSKDRDDSAVADARRSARQTLSGIAERIDLDVSSTAGGRGLSLYRPLDPEQMDAMRREAAAAIVRLKTAME